MPPRLPPIWVINLPRSAARRTVISEHLAALDLEFELIPAIDGRELSREEIAACYNSTESGRRFGRDLTPSEIGCALSHLALYRRQAEMGLEEVLILEDDVELPPQFPELLARRHLLPPDWELINFCRGDTRVSFWGQRNFTQNYRTVRFASIAYNAGGYLLRLSGATKMLKAALPISCPADHLTGGDIRAGLRIYGLQPPCIRHREGESTMPEAHALQPRWPRKGELPPLVWFLHRAKWNTLHFWQRLNPFSRI